MGAGGKGYLLAVGNCTPPGHGGVFHYAYDWNLETGTLVTAARASRVVPVR